MYNRASLDSFCYIIFFVSRIPKQYNPFKRSACHGAAKRAPAARQKPAGRPLTARRPAAGRHQPAAGDRPPHSLPPAAQLGVCWPSPLAGCWLPRNVDLGAGKTFTPP